MSVLSDRLNDLGKKWGNRNIEDEDACNKLENDILFTIYELYTTDYDEDYPIDYRDGLTTFWTKFWKDFDPEKGLLTTYVKNGLKYSLEKIDKNKEFESHTKTIKLSDYEKAKTGIEKKKYRVSPDHLNEPLKDKSGEDQNEEKIDQVSYDDDQYNDFVMRDDIDRTLLQVISIMIDIRKHLSGKSNNEKSVLYKKLFHTETASMLCQEGVVDDEYPHERELIESLKYTFLDYYTLDEACRSIEAIRRSPLKRLCDISEEDPDNNSEAKLPLKQSVFITYLKRCEGYEKVSDSNITDQRKKYYKFLKEHIEREK